jgi:hypothetical protein
MMATWVLYSVDVERVRKLTTFKRNPWLSKTTESLHDWVYRLSAPSSGILQTTKCNVSEFLASDVGDWVPILLGPLEPTRITGLLKIQFLKLCLTDFKILDNGQSPKTQESKLPYTSARTLLNLTIYYQYLIGIFHYTRNSCRVAAFQNES